MPASRLFPARPLALAALAVTLGASSAPAFDIRAMSAEEEAAFGAAVRSYLVENPQVLMEAINALQTQQQQAQAEGDSGLIAANADAIFDDGWSWVGGNPEGDITVVEFIDYRCGYCRKAHSEVLDLVESDGNIRYIVKEFPILSEDSVTAARFAMSALGSAGPEAYQKVNHAFYTSYKGPFTADALSELGDELGFDGAAAVAGMDAPEIERALQENHALAQRLQIQGTPTFVMGEQMLRGYVPLEGMRQVIAEERG